MMTTTATAKTMMTTTTMMLNVGKFGIVYSTELQKTNLNRKSFLWRTGSRRVMLVIERNPDEIPL